MKTTLDLDDQLVIAAKKLAADRGETMTAVIEEGLRTVLRGNKRDGKPFKLTWRPVRGRLRDDVDLNDRSELYDVMDGRRWRGDRR